ncbi:MAG: beta-ketoacyl-ACP synthase III [Chloroflexota bacterium]
MNISEKRTYSHIAGWGAYTPERIVTNHELEQRPELDTSDEWIVQRTGIRERRVAADHETTATLSVEAAQIALANANLKPSDLDLIIVATCTPDYFAPPVSSQVQHMLGATDVPAFVLVTGCTGFIYGLSTADQFIRTGVYRNILVIGVELLSRFVNWQDRNTCVLFGDGAGAAIVQARETRGGILGFDLGSDGTKHDVIILPAGGSAQPFGPEALAEGGQYLRMNGREVFKFATRIIGPSSTRALEQADTSLDDINWFVPHQANLRIIQAASKLMKQPMDRFVVSIDRYANTSAASIPIAIYDALESGQMSPTDTLLLVSFGAGLTWASAVLELTG